MSCGNETCYSIFLKNPNVMIHENNNLSFSSNKLVRLRHIKSWQRCAIFLPVCGQEKMKERKKIELGELHLMMNVA